jgi:hypothetical protein
MKIPTPALRLAMAAWLSLLAILVSACANAQATQIPHYPVSMEVRLKSDSASLIMFSECGTPFGSLAGLANNGDVAVIVDRQNCNGSWWYQVQVPALKSEKWHGIGWVPEESIKVK